MASRSRRGQIHGAEPSSVPAQVRAGGMLVEMLRSRYRIPAANCVTHAQVSVNPSNMQAGYHTDWAFGFPFEQVGLPDNYTQDLPSLWAFGFQYAPGPPDAAESGVYGGAARTEARIEGAAAAGIGIGGLPKVASEGFRERFEEAALPVRVLRWFRLRLARYVSGRSTDPPVRFQPQFAVPPVHRVSEQAPASQTAKPNRSRSGIGQRSAPRAGP